MSRPAEHGRILLTGATGFIGKALSRQLAHDERVKVRVAIRRRNCTDPAPADAVIIGDLGSHSDWSAALEGVDVILHCAARAHVFRDRAPDPLEEFRRVNVNGTMNLAREAARVGVRRFVFLSSVAVHGEGIEASPYRPSDPPAPCDPYGVSKYEAEQELSRLSHATGTEVVIIRPVLVYGPGVGGRFLAMMRWLDRGLPVPVRNVTNKRSLVAVDNLVDLVVRCLYHPNAANQSFLVSDGNDLSTPELMERTARFLGQKAHLFSIPQPVLRALARVTGKETVIRRLCGSLTVDISKTRDLLGWTPVVTTEDALRRTAEHFLRSRFREPIRRLK